VLVLLAIWSPWNSWNINFYNLFGIENAEKYSGLKVKSLSGEVYIYVDNKFEGTITDNEDFADIGSIQAGSHTVALKRKQENNYYILEKKINFEEGVDVVIAYDLGPNEKFSEGHVFYAKKNYLNEGKPKLNIYSVPDRTKVYMDNIYVGDAPLVNIDLNLDLQHKIKLQKVGYETLEFTILPEEIEIRKKLSGFDLIIEAQLFLKPIKTVNQ
jgi:hypothetical protein